MIKFVTCNQLVIRIYYHMNSELTTSPYQHPSSTHQQNEIIRNFQQLLKLKLMREERKRAALTNFNKRPSLLSVCMPSSEQQKVIKKKTLEAKSNSLKSTNPFIQHHSTHLQVNSLHVRSQASQLVTISRHKISSQRKKYEPRSLSHRNNNLTQLQHARSLQEQYVRSKDRLIDQKQVRVNRRSVVSLQSIGTGILPLTPTSNIVSLQQLLRLRTVEKQTNTMEERQRMKKSFRYNDIPISEFLYENNRKPSQVSSGIQRKLESICRPKEKEKASHSSTNRQTSPS